MPAARNLLSIPHVGVECPLACMCAHRLLLAEKSILSFQFFNIDDRHRSADEM